MAESSACLVRSFSTPADTCYEGNPIRALGESISFGRFMSEELDWEKWSTFTHNRYVEEAEKYSKPGSVAAKKAYFEARYKRKAAERAAAWVQEANALANGTTESSIDTSCIVENEEHDKEIVDYHVVECVVDRDQQKCDAGQSDLCVSNTNDVVANEEQDKETVNYRVVECVVNRDQHECDAGQSDLGILNVEEAEDSRHPRIDIYLNVESCTLDDDSNSSQFHHVEDKKNIVVPVEVLALPVKGREANYSPELSTETVSQENSPSLDERKDAAAVPTPQSGINNGSKGKKSVSGDSVEKKNLTAQSLRVSINLPSGTGETRKRVAVASRSRNGLNNFSTSKKSVGGLNEKKKITAPSSGTGITSKTVTAATKPSAKSMKSVGHSVEMRPTTRSLHMSISLPSGAGETSKTASMLEQNRVKRLHSNLPKTKASHGLLNQDPANHPSQRPLNKSVSGSVTANAKPSSSSNTIKNIPQSATVSSPFRFRSEERAVKRKEFLQRMDETKSKDEEKVKLQRTLKGKTEHDHKKLRQSSGSISKLNEDKQSGSHSTSNQIRKSSLALPRSPKLGKKASSSIVQGKSLGNSWKPPIRTNNSKRTTEKINRTTRQSVTSISNTTRENASPNIQL